MPFPNNSESVKKTGVKKGKWGFKKRANVMKGYSNGLPKNI